MIRLRVFITIFASGIFIFSGLFSIRAAEGPPAANHAMMHEDSHSAMDHESMGQGHDHAKMVMEAQKEDAAALAEQVKVEERLGEHIAQDAVFKNEKGEAVTLKNLFDKPVVLLPVYFTCTSVCNFLQAELANALNRVKPVPGKDFNVITLSFDDEEDSAIALTSKKNYANLIQRDVDLDNWYYLTGDVRNIKKVTDSLGYYFIKKGKHMFIHPSALVVLAADGKIIRYLYGPSFLPFDVGMALAEAQKGEPGVSIKRGVLSFCFGYDPENKTYVFKTFRITGLAILLLLAGFVIFLVYPSKRDRKSKDKTVS